MFPILQSSNALIIPLYHSVRIRDAVSGRKGVEIVVRKADIARTFEYSDYSRGIGGQGVFKYKIITEFLNRLSKELR